MKSRVTQFLILLFFIEIIAVQNGSFIIQTDLDISYSGSGVFFNSEFVLQSWFVVLKDERLTLLVDSYVRVQKNATSSSQSQRGVKLLLQTVLRAFEAFRNHPQG